MNAFGRTVAVLAMAAIPLPPAMAAETTPSISIDGAWLRATPKNAAVAGGYATITNKGAEADRLLSASLPIAADGEVHSMTTQQGVMHMERLDQGLVIAPGQAVTLKPGSYHLMFLKPSAQLREGETIGGTLVFEKAGAVAVRFAVGGMAAQAAPGAEKDGAAGPHHSGDR